MAGVPRLLGLATAAPPHEVKQEDAAEMARALFADIPHGFEHFAPVFANADIETRHSCVPIAWYGAEHGFAEKNALYIDNALDLVEEAAVKALREAGLEPGAIDAIVTVSSTASPPPRSKRA